MGQVLPPNPVEAPVRLRAVTRRNRFGRLSPTTVMLAAAEGDIDHFR